MSDEVLQDDPYRRVVRIGDTVRRPLHPWSTTVHELLQHLQEQGFEYAPRLLGIDDEGREVLTWIDGESGGDGWAKVVTDEGLTAMARLLRDYHDAVRDFRPSSAAGWAAHDGVFRPGDLVCHGDFGPWNLVWHGNTPIGILDWDYTWPHPPLHDVVYALEYVAPFRDDEFAMSSMRHPAAPDRRRRMEVFAAAYGLTAIDGLADGVIAQQEEVLARVRRLAAEGRQPQLTWQESGALAGIERRIEQSRELALDLP
ncbi:phosphotransferase [Actinoplanes italicus]|uniref:Phosphotransferase family enzyme n=1 Tax=Actinoplanes italicus TaxID=113567 RepID=A0A2T0K6E7_9ACTN|nr:aminoglycoside phosphotransferase family protein [Actinoplanes italicus]PRX18366.1 phosphotransferase family enzyme [Actinoplanes italicus]GIE32775.1 phosphotransferase [Actinoplanes italicus]